MNTTTFLAKKRRRRRSSAFRAHREMLCEKKIIALLELCVLCHPVMTFASDFKELLFLAFGARATRKGMSFFLL